MTVLLDHAATTPVRDEVREVLDRHLRDLAGNPSSTHAAGRAARSVLEAAREQVADALVVSPHDVVFTSGGTEADNLAVKGLALAAAPGDLLAAADGTGRRRPGPQEARDGHVRRAHVVSTAVEHPAVRDSVRWLRDAHGFALTEVGCRPDGTVAVEDVLDAVRPSTVLVTCMAANNETGAVNDVVGLAAGLRSIRHVDGWTDGPAGVAATAGDDHDRGPRRRGVVAGHGPARPGARASRGPTTAVRLHVDAVQALATRDVAPIVAAADSVALTAHKVGGPVGIGVLLRRRGVPMAPLLHGGGQDRGLRSGTLPAALAAAGATAIALAVDEREALDRRLADLRGRLVGGLAGMDGVAVTSPAEVLSSHVHLTVEGVDGEALAFLLDAAGIACSGGAACAAGSSRASHVLEALEAADPSRPRGAPVRLSLGRSSTAADVDAAGAALRAATARLRATGGGRVADPRGAATEVLA